MHQESFGSRRLVLLGPTETEVFASLHGPFALLLLAEAKMPSADFQDMIHAALVNGCVEFCCMGKYSEELHDSIDALLEERGLVQIVTTWHGDEPLEESLYYFVNLAGSRPPTLLAMVEGNHTFENVLRKTFKEHSQ
jgi:hypothetical protein